MVRFVHLTTDQTEIQARKIHVIPTVCPACLSSTAQPRGFPKIWRLCFDLDFQRRCLCSEVSVWERAPFSRIMLPWSRTSGWRCSDGRDSLVARGQSCGSALYSQDCLEDFLSNDYRLKMHILEDMVWHFQTTRFLLNILPGVILC